MVPFAIGSETCGSISYPAARCGVTALRPTFGAVGRTGVMSIAESLVLLLPPSSSLPLFCGILIYFYMFRISLDRSVEVLQIAQLFWTPF